MNRPQSQEYPAWAQPYIELVPDNLLEFLSNQEEELHLLIRSFNGRKNEGYAIGKWTPKELVGHVIDTERIFAFRMMSFARLEAQALPGFSENDYVASAYFNERSWENLADEFLGLRKSNRALIASFSAEEFSRSGEANQRSMSVKALAFMIAGHAAHHLRILKERY